MAYAGVTSDRLVGGGLELKLSWGTQTLLRIIKKHQTKRILLLILVLSRSTWLCAWISAREGASSVRLSDIREIEKEFDENQVQFPSLELSTKT